jgi:hypothetical protein
MPAYRFNIGDRVVITVDLDDWVRAGTAGEVVDRLRAEDANLYRVLCDLIPNDPYGKRRERMVREDNLALE